MFIAPFPVYGENRAFSFANSYISNAVVVPLPCSTITIPTDCEAAASCGEIKEKAVSETKDVSFDWSSYLGVDTIASSTWASSDPALTLSNAYLWPDKTLTTVFISGGVTGAGYFLTNTVTTTGGRTLSHTIQIVIIQYNIGDASSGECGGCGGTDYTITPIANNTVLGNVSGITNFAYPLSSAQLAALIGNFSGSIAGLVPAVIAPTGTKYLNDQGAFSTPGGGSGSGTVTNFSATGNNGISVSVANPTTTPTLTLGLGAITPTSVLSSGNLSGANLSGTNTGDQTNITGNAGTVTTINGRITAGTNITLSGAGTSASPYNISAASGNAGTVTSMSIVSANGFAGAVANATTTPAVTLSTSVTGLIKGVASAFVAAVAGTDYQAPITLTTTGTSGASTFASNTLNIPQYASGITTLTGDITASGSGSVAATLATVNSNVGSFTNANITVNAKGLITAAANGTVTSGTVTSISVVSANGLAGTVATATTTPAITLSTSVTGILKGNGTAISAAAAGTDYIAPYTSQTANTFLASPNGSAGTPSFRSIVAADVPTLNQNTTGSAGTVATIASLLAAGANITITGSGTSGSPYVIAAVGASTTMGMTLAIAKGNFLMQPF